MQSLNTPMRYITLIFAIIDIKKQCHHNMVSKNFSGRVWYFGIKNTAKIIHKIPTEKLNGRTPIEAGTGEKTDISEYVDYDFYDLVWYQTGKHPRTIKEN